MSNPARATRNVLIIDDEDDIREVAGLSLEMTEGWRVATAASCAIGIELARTSRPDAILLDVMMPGIDGPAALREIRRDPVMKDIPVLFLTAKVQQGDLKRFLDLGVQGVIAKPFDPMALGQQVRELLGWPAAAAP